MKKIFTFFAVCAAALTLISCNKDGDALYSFYEYQKSSLIREDNLHKTDISAIDDVLAQKIQYNNNMYKISDAQADAEWADFLSKIDDSKVKFGYDDEFYTVSFVKINVYEKGEFESESKVVREVGKRTWKKSGVE